MPAEYPVVNLRSTPWRRVGLGIFLATFAAAIGAQAPTRSGRENILPAPTPAATADRDARAITPSRSTNRIVGGHVSAGRPFIAALLYQKGGSYFQYCGASVIADRWLLTAAHCEVKAGDMALVGRARLDEAGGARFRIYAVYTHPGYNASNHNNDLAMLKLASDISKAVPRVTLAAPPAAGTVLTAAGWGATEEGGKTVLELREVGVPLLVAAECSRYPELTGNMVCAGAPGLDSCQGDSGGPLFLAEEARITQIGITSFGLGCGRLGFPGVYTRVDRYADWIADTLRQ